MEIKVEAGTQSNRQSKIRGEGMTIIRSRQRGDLFVRFQVETPTRLTARQKELLEEFRSLSKDDECQPEARSFFEKIKDLFKKAV